MAGETLCEGSICLEFYESWFILLLFVMSTLSFRSSQMKHLCDLTFLKGHTIRECNQCFIMLSVKQLQWALMLSVLEENKIKFWPYSRSLFLDWPSGVLTSLTDGKICNCFLFFSLSYQANCQCLIIWHVVNIGMQLKSDMLTYRLKISGFLTPHNSFLPCTVQHKIIIM